MKRRKTCLICYLLLSFFFLMSSRGAGISFLLFSLNYTLGSTYFLVVLQEIFKSKMTFFLVLGASSPLQKRFFCAPGFRPSSSGSKILAHLLLS